MVGSRVKFYFYLIILRNVDIFDLITHVVFFTLIKRSGNVSWVRRLVAGLTPHRPRFIPRPAYLRFVVDKVTMGHISI